MVLAEHQIKLEIVKGGTIFIVKYMVVWKGIRGKPYFILLSKMV